MTDPTHIAGMYRSYLSYFVRLAFGEIPGNGAFLPNWHIDVLSKAMVDVLSGKTPRLIVNLPPRTLKSFVVSVAFVAFALGKDPTLKILVLAGTPALYKDLRDKLRIVMRSERYRSVFGHISFNPNRPDIRLPQGGGVTHATYGTDIIGQGFDLIIIDDPQSPEDAKDPDAQARTNSYVFSSVLPRLNDGSKSKAVLVQQRLHTQDLSWTLYSRDRSWKSLAIPAIVQRDQSYDTEFGPFLRWKNSPIFAKRETREELRTRLYAMGPRDFAAQYLQEPRPDNYRGQPGNGFIWARPPDNWNGEGTFSFALARLPEDILLDVEAFGGARFPFTFDNPRPLTGEEWELVANSKMHPVISTQYVGPFPEGIKPYQVTCEFDMEAWEKILARRPASQDSKPVNTAEP